MAKPTLAGAKSALPSGKRNPALKASETVRANLSRDVVGESDSDTSSGTSDAGSDSESEQEKRQNTTKSDEKKVKVTEPSIPAVTDDTSSEEDEDDDEGSETETSSEDELPDVGAAATKKQSVKPQASTVKTNGTKRKADDSSSNEQPSVDNEVLPDAPQSKKARVEPPQTVATPIPTRAFQAPPGYKPITPAPAPGFNPKDLSTKQIWHITAPSDLPISALKEVSIEAIAAGTPVLTYKSTDYVLAELSSASASTLLVPEKEGYTPVAQRIARTLQLKEHVVLPDLSAKQASQFTGSAQAAHIKTPAVSSIRPQPRGLKMRYRPPGFGAEDPGKIGSGSESEEDEPVAFKLPRSGEESQKRAGETKADASQSKEKRKKDKSKEKDKSKRKAVVA